ncbi:MAG: transcription termination/antitermination protein NusA [candidate division Zixibacteria bacterium]|nr:transcription termination/antitermination protein NusA [candidate division Zixibacteria bacterium]
MNYEILEALSQITKNKNIDMDFVIQTLEASLMSAAKKKFGNTDNIAVNVDPTSGEIKITATKKVVEQEADPNTEIALEKAQEIDPEVDLGDEVEVDVGFDQFGRNAISVAKQNLIQKVREAERQRIYEEYKDKVETIVTGGVQQIEKGHLIVNLGRAEGIIPPKEQIPKERYRQGDRIRALIIDVQETAKGPQIVLSRASPVFLKRLFELEVPEIYERIIEIKAVAREPGERCKIAVSSIDDRVDPVGACVGVKGTRVQSIVRELSSERIDIVPWNPDPENFATRALAPAKVVHIDTYHDDNSMTIVVEDDRLSLAIGRAGQNARLAAKLTGWKINILSESEYREQKKLEEQLKIYVTELPGVGKKLKEKLTATGIETIQDLAKSSVEDLVQIEGVGKKRAESLIEKANEYLSPSQAGEE